jgi:hypothetical protein
VIDIDGQSYLKQARKLEKKNANALQRGNPGETSSCGVLGA